MELQGGTTHQTCTLRRDQIPFSVDVMFRSKDPRPSTDLVSSSTAVLNQGHDNHNRTSAHRQHNRPDRHHGRGAARSGRATTGTPVVIAGDGRVAVPTECRSCREFLPLRWHPVGMGPGPGTPALSGSWLYA